MKLLRVLAVPAALVLVAACGGGGSPGASQSTAPGSTPSATTGAHPVSQTTARPPAMVGVTARGSLVLLSPATGARVVSISMSGSTGASSRISLRGRWLAHGSSAVISRRVLRQALPAANNL